MGDHSEAFIGLGYVEVAECGCDSGRRPGVARFGFLGEIDNTPAATAKLVRKLSGKYERLTFLLRGRTNRLRTAPANQGPWASNAWWSRLHSSQSDQATR